MILVLDFLEQVLNSQYYLQQTMKNLFRMVLGVEPFNSRTKKTVSLTDWTDCCRHRHRHRQDQDDASVFDRIELRVEDFLR
jgi:hypothetical protein